MIGVIPFPPPSSERKGELAIGATYFGAEGGGGAAFWTGGAY